MNSIHLSEDPYLSINGEGTLAGYPVIFIRVQGCKVGCNYCDSKYTWKGKTDISRDWSFEEINDKVESIGVNYPKWLTGGEVLEQWDRVEDYLIYDLEKPINSNNKLRNVMISAVPIYVDNLSDYIDHLIIDVKLKNANIQYDQIKIIDKYIDNMYLELKTVVSPDNIDEALNVADRYPDNEITFQPMYWDENQYKNAKKNIKDDRFKILASNPEGLSMSDWFDLMMKSLNGRSNIRLLPQIHKTIWPGIQRGI